MIWTILGIEETKDKKAITSAYREKLSSVNPEEKPEEFKELRAAYEEALRLADETENEQMEKTEIDFFVDKLDVIYHDFQKRISVDAWKELVNSDICQDLSTRDEALFAILRYFMEHFYISHEIMVFLDKEFSLEERADELCENFPKDFIHYIILDNIHYGNSTPYDMFKPGIDGAAVDDYCRTLNKLRGMSFADFEEPAAHLEALPEGHPYGEALLLRYKNRNGDDTAEEKLSALCEEYPDDEQIYTEYAVLLLDNKKYEEAVNYADKILNINKNHISAYYIKRDALAALEKYKEASEMVDELMSRAGGDQKRLYELNEIRKEYNEKLIEKYTAAVESNSEDFDSIFELAWCYLENGDNEKAFEFAERLPENCPDPYSYNKLLMIINNSLKNYSKASEFGVALLESLKDLKPDGTRKTERRLESVDETYFQVGINFLLDEKKEEAFTYFDQAMINGHDNPNVLSDMITVCFRDKDYEKAAEYSAKLTEVMPSSYHGYVLLAKALYMLGKDQDAFNAVNTAIDIDPGDLEEYLIKLKILVRNGAVEPAEELLQFLADNQVEDMPEIIYIKGMIADRKGNNTEAYELYKSIEKDLDEAESKPDWGADYYYKYTAALAGEMDARKDYNREPLFRLLEKGLECDPDDFDVLEYKAWLLKKDKKNKESLDIYHKLEGYPRSNRYIERQLAELYYDDLSHCADISLKYYKMLIEENEEASENYFFAGMCCLYMEDLEGAENYLSKLKEIDPEDIDGYFRLTTAYSLRNETLALAEENGRKTIELAENRKDDTVRFFTALIRALRRMGKPDEAADVLYKLKVKNKDYAYYNKFLFEIYSEFGVWERVDDLLSTWKHNTKERAQYVNSLSKYQMYRKDIRGLKWTILNWGSMLGIEANARINAFIGLSKGKTKAFVNMFKNEVEEAEKNNSGKESAYSSYAFALWVTGNKEEAKKYARLSVEESNKEMELFDLIKSIHRGQRSVSHAILGDTENALKDISDMRTCPLCRTCDFTSCKDADLFEARIEMVLGNYEKAALLVSEGEKKWPDEEDFIFLEYLLDIEMKGKK